MHGALLRTNAVRIRLLATARRKSGYLRYAAVRDVNLTALRYVAEAVRLRLFALRYTTARREFLAMRHTATYRCGAI